ncbi:RecF/RecN/SMC [Nemania sp. NC0429]|nr:RecF/RecN/SMC [Nemania sp. NC0429]
MGKLVRLELFNFKSYKGHHTLLLGDSYFTSIIGPNGSGKSNSMDAISFVLGIKSSHLRSAHLKDLVYRGRVLKTSKINDDGSAVDVIANGQTNGHVNGDDHDKPNRSDPKTAWQRWKRTITNQGSSEYRINDPLEAENILIKARNFLVFQGDVEAIASQSPQDLTRLIEQISGSLEYKAEYERLQNEADQRRGINSEIRQYQEQKKEALSFQDKTNERDTAIVTHVLWKLYNFQREHQENLKEKLEDARREQVDAHKEVHKAERQIKKQEKELEEKENILVPIDEKVQQTTNQAETVRKRIESVQKERDEQAKLIAKIEKDLVTVQKAQKLFEDQWKETMQKQGKELSDADRKEYNSLRAQAMAKSSENQAKLENLNRQLKTDEVTVNSLRGKVDAYQAAAEKLETELATIKERRDATQASAKEFSAEIDAKKKEFHAIQSEKRRTAQRRDELHEKRMALRRSDKERRTREMIASLKRLFPGVKGQVAVITALGRDFDSVIVDKKRFAPMTFIPLDNIKVNAVNTAVKGISGARLTIDTIDFDPSLERAMSYAFAKHICFDRRIRVKAVTLDGTVIHKAGLMTGGHGPEHRGGKRRFEDADVQSLERALEKNQQELDALPRSDRRNTAEETVRNELAELEQRLQYSRNELAHFEQNLSSKKKELDHVKRQLKEWQPKFKEEDTKLQKTRSSVEKFKTAIAQVEDKVFSDFCKRLGYSDIRAYEAQQGSWEAEAAEKRSQFDLQKSRLESNKSWEVSRHSETEGRLRSLEDRLKRLSQDIKTYEREKAEIEETMGGDRDNLAALEEQLEQLKEELETQNEKVNNAKADVQKRSKDIDNRLKAITALETELQKNSAGKFALLRRCRLEQIDIPLSTGSLDNLPNEDNLLHQDPDAMDVDDADDAEMMEDALNDYGIEINYDDLDDDLKNPDDEHIEDQLQEKISSLTAELEKLNPNMRAMERLEVVEARLKATENDFEESKTQHKAAKEAFDEVKAKRFELFDKAFTHIREQISQVYKDLTRSDQYPLGGQAYLDIEEDTDKPYLSGIKYHAMPPLKRFRDMEHLSGGEKTMAALALLFAIHSYQPSPFFVLDEVDAALDNANVEKIKNYIRNHAGPGMQFVVISLKAGLFQDSESLVGVYRDQEVNSSKTLTLDLRKYN